MMDVPRLLAICLGAAVLCLASGCPRPAPQPNAPALKPITLLPADAAPAFIWEQRVTASWQGRSRGFDAVLQRAGDSLLLVGLSPLKQPGFIVRYRKGRVSFENKTGREVPFRPEYIIGDVQLAYYPWLAPIKPGFNGVRRGTKNGLSLAERYQDGRLVERRASRLAQPQAGEVVISYRDWHDGDPTARKVRLENGWYHYALDIETYSMR